MNDTRNHHFQEIRNIDLKQVIEVPLEFRIGIVKCRVLYGRMIERIEFEHYVFRQPQSFKMVDGNKLNYTYKYADRSSLKELYNQRGKADDILIFKNGLLTDSFYANVAVLKNGIWYTPNQPLLEGTYRSKLLMNEKLVKANISKETIHSFHRIKLFNALLEWTGHDSVVIQRNVSLF
ncbi:aminotransferase class IV [Portibacter marinus]|uniref:aminotransferase class IV n=1 Tax=Portibacter marinus TaxID=2898660 RepID=UPI001F40FFF6|nr:aminotransferase class IV [Portibacter marinus]